ncbi:MAG: cytochrome-c oxidase, cbb3-type subunit III [Alphaproteobacteria bacterium]|nr:cytochrome-c oxidase, cbb3-type subunit III [Alphaproteobacteria bacterium]MDX5369777.1 cytochrome-c oxidase, cbb3-type subunit III [Alphaproteobacteria bacterium]MDX5464401.1 cytochrome-c oxidase, cbb3-type subunit III [Alphaproteobacteria bacterium]
MAHERERDHHTGTETTGHEWDGIKELNTPLPKWWLYVFYATIVWSIGYWIVYPAWPLAASYTKGIWGYSQRERVMENVEQAKAAQSGFVDRIREASLQDIVADDELRQFAMAGGRAAFGDNCAACHGTGAQGAPGGYPSLVDDAWLWGGTLDDIHTTLEVGIRADHPDTRLSEMPAFGVDQILSREEIDQVSEYVLSLSGTATNQQAAEAGATIFADNCAACHGENGEGMVEMGAPNLADAIWLYGGEKADVVYTVTHSRAGVMPAWSGRLSPETIKQLTVYVHELGGGQ